MEEWPFRSGRLRPAEAEPGHPGLERRGPKSQSNRGAARTPHPPPRLLQHFSNVIPLHVHQPQAAPPPDGQRRGDRDCQPGSARENHRPLHGIAKFPDVPRPRVPLQRRHVLRRHFLDPLAEPGGELLDEPPHQQRDVLGPFSQWRYAQREYIEPIEEVRPERTVGDALFEADDASRR